MEYQNKLSRLRHAFLKLQGQDLVQVLLRAAAKEAESAAHEVHTSEEIFHAIKDKIYEATNELPYNTKFELASDLESLTTLKKELIEDTAESFRWDEMLHVLLEGLEGTNRKVIETLLINQHSSLLESKKFNSSSNSVAGLDRVIVPMVRRVYESIPIGTLVGIQPMQGPVGLTHLLRYREQDKETGKITEIVDRDNSFTTEGKKISLEVIAQPVEASSKRLSSGWTIEAAQDIRSMNGLDIESEMVQALSQEVRDEISTSIIYDLFKLASYREEPVMAKLNGTPKEQIEKLRILINLACNQIASRTRRGAGNWIVLPYSLVPTFEELVDSKTYTKKEYNGFSVGGTLMEIGTLNGGIKVFSALYTAEDEILVGYKGTGECDTGYVHCPYMPIISSGVVVHPETFEPIVTLMTRYGTTVNAGNIPDPDDKEGKKKIQDYKAAADYYNIIKIESDVLVTKPKK